MTKKATMGAMALMFLTSALLSAAGAAEIKVLSTGNMVSIMTDLTGPFERATGHKLVIEYGSYVLMRNRIGSGEVADLTINERPVLNELLKQGRITTGSIVDVARSPFGVGVRAGAPTPANRWRRRNCRGFCLPPRSRRSFAQKAWSLTRNNTSSTEQGRHPEVPA